MNVEPKPQHALLQKLVGQWSYEHECDMGPDQPKGKFKGTERVRPIGKLWIVGEGEGQLPDGEPANTIITLGFDDQKNRFVGTFIGSMMAQLWVYDGAIDASQKILTLDTEGPSMSGEGKRAKYQDIIEFVSDDHRILRSKMQDESGGWTQFMEAHYHRIQR